MGFQNENVPDICIRRKIADNSGKANLYRLVVNAEAKRVFNGTCDYIPGNAFRPIGIRKEVMNYINIKSRGIRTKGEPIFSQRDMHTGFKRRSGRSSRAASHPYI